MDWIQTCTIIGVNIALFGSLATLVVWMTNKLDGDIKGLSARMDGHAQRIDQLYHMFIDLIKEGRK
jgi:hypothetical protein